ncbi:glycosyltransferase [Flagellimonas sp. CMM7]|uniref:glycosyltransferase family 2 protein n=1 Tax=Flagellimonas sp. CMM7 TaxID=2654676 RepID=UPI0013D6F852|nr:glycosyltransferase [Flagellimonas sp. CMM7]UII79909.1 glycosyltransferase [Flagellimonas sp. CMM7]
MAGYNSMSKNPLISIVIPVYNVEIYLEQCLDSIISQTYQNLEIILVNDGSVDASGRICDDYAKRDSRIKVVHQANQGVSEARNTAIKLATGELASYVDSDDWIEIDMYETLVKKIVEFDLDVIEFGIVGRLKDNQISNEICIEDYLQTYKRIIKYNQFAAWRRLYKIELIKDYTWVVGRIASDVQFSIDNLRKAKKIGYLPLPFYNYRKNPDSITKSRYTLKNLDSLEAGLYLKKIIVKTENDVELLKTVQDHLLNKFLYHYKMLNYFPKLDKDYTHRNRVKALIDGNYYKNKKHHTYLKLAHYLPPTSFHLLIYLNNIKRKINKD